VERPAATEDADTRAIRAIYDALAAGDVGPLVERMDDAIEWHEPEGAPVVAGTFRGRAAVLGEVLARMPEVWDEFAVDPREFIAAGGRVIVTGDLTVRARGTGGGAVVPFVHIWELREGRIVSWRCHTDTALLHAARTSR
jgi:ketosteroid isomerase-like protein